MARLRNRKGKFYARVRWQIKGEEKEKLVPLRTSSKAVAYERLTEVNAVEGGIKSGVSFSFPWLSDQTKIKVKRYTLKDASDEWLDSRNTTPNTLTLNKQGTDYFITYLSEDKPINNIISNNIIGFIDFLKSKGLSINTINIHLRTIKTMFGFLLKNDRINKIPLIEQLKVRKKDPIYIAEKEFEKIMSLDWLDPFYKDVFSLYLETGMRLREPFISTLEGNWIDITEESKGGSSRNIELDSHLKEIFIKYTKWLTDGYGSTIKDQGDHISKVFKKCLISVGAHKDKHFHSLRHTFAVKSLIKGMAIYDLKLILGHSSVTTTEVYANMNLKRVAQDFPSLSKHYRNSTKLSIRDTTFRDTRLTTSDYIA